jgi:hypothetical protein
MRCRAPLFETTTNWCWLRSDMPQTGRCSIDCPARLCELVKKIRDRIEKGPWRLQLRNVRATHEHLQPRIRQ